MNPDTIIACVANAVSTSHASSANNCWLCKKEIKIEKKKRGFKDDCHLWGRFTGLAHIKCNLSTRKAHSSFVTLLSHNFSRYDSRLIFVKLVKMTTEKGTMLGEEDTIAKLPENYKSVKIGRLKVVDSYRFIDSSLDKLYTTLKPFPSLDANEWKTICLNES